jgi:hypothetical protein
MRTLSSALAFSWNTTGGFQGGTGHNNSGTLAMGGSFNASGALDTTLAFQAPGNITSDPFTLSDSFTNLTSQTANDALTSYGAGNSSTSGTLPAGAGAPIRFILKRHHHAARHCGCTGSSRHSHGSGRRLDARAGRQRAQADAGVNATRPRGVHPRSHRRPAAPYRAHAPSMVLTEKSLTMAPPKSSSVPPLSTIVPMSMPPELTCSMPPLLTVVPLAMPPE